MPVTKVRSQWSGGELRFRETTNNRVLPHKIGPNEDSLALSDNTTLDETHCGRNLYVTADAKTITLPATVVGYFYRIINGGADGTVAVTVSPNANDKIMGMGVTSADNKDFVNTKATAKEGDTLELLGDGVNGWMVVRVLGTWAKEG